MHGHLEVSKPNMQACFVVIWLTPYTPPSDRKRVRFMTSSRDQIAALRDALAPYEAVTVMPHTNPDPDAIASTVALSQLLRRWGKVVHSYYEGRIGRAENKSLMTYLERPIAPLLDDPTDPIILVDTQPHNGNNPLPRSREIWGTIDHHPLHLQSQLISYSDVRPEIGATATIMTEYLRSADFVPDTKLATALFYGLKTDTLDLERRATAADIVAYDYLRPLIDKQALALIEKAQVSAEYFRFAYNALKQAQVYGPLLISYLGEISYPDFPAEMADWLMRFDKVTWVVCIGQYKDKMYLSVRSHPPISPASALVRAMVADLGTGGGHDTMAAGQVPVNDEKPSRIVRQLRKNALRHLNIPEKTPSIRLLAA